MALPKVFSLFGTRGYEERFPQFGIIGRPKNLFYTCYYYDVRFPIADKERDQVLNVFEKAVLKYLNLKPGSVDETAEVLCLNKDLVNFILIRLKEQGFTDKDNMLTDKGKNILGSYKKENEKSIKYISGQIFVCCSDVSRILPYIHVNPMENESVLECEYGKIKIAVGDIGDGRTISGNYLNKRPESLERPALLKTEQIRKAVLEYNRLGISLANNFEPLSLDKEYAIENTYSGRVALHLQAAVQKGNTDEVLVSEGFVPHLDFLAEQIKRDYPEVYRAVKESALVSVQETGEKAGKEPKTRKYPEIYKLLLRKKYSNETKYLDEKREEANEKKINIIKCFGAIEWCFHYYLTKYPVPEDLVGAFCAQRTAEDNEVIIKDILGRIGLKNVNESNKALISNLHPEKIKEYLQAETPIPSIYMVFPLALAEASQDSYSSIHKLINVMPDLMDFLACLNRRAQNLRHNSSESDWGVSDDEIEERTLKLVHTVLPEIDPGSYEVSERREDISQIRIRAELSLSKKMGSVLYYSLEKDLRNELMRISPDKSENNLPAPYEYSLGLARIAEMNMIQVLENIQRNQKRTKEEALKKIEEWLGEKVPVPISTVGKRFYQNVLEGGQRGTLGAYCIVLLSSMTDSGVYSGILDDLKMADYVGTISRICELRAHGNSIGLCTDIKQLNSLRDKVIDSIKITRRML